MDKEQLGWWLEFPEKHREDVFEDDAGDDEGEDDAGDDEEKDEEDGDDEGDEDDDGPDNDPSAVRRATVSPVGKGIEKKGTLNEKGPKKKKKKKRGKF